MHSIRPSNTFLSSTNSTNTTFHHNSNTIIHYHQPNIYSFPRQTSHTEFTPPFLLSQRICTKDIIFSFKFKVIQFRRIRKGLYKLFDAQLTSQYKKRMSSSGQREHALKHETKTVTHRINSLAQTTLNANKNPTRANRITESPSRNAASCQSRSKSKHKKLSASKLFAKAHQACDGETYLTYCKSVEGPHTPPLRQSAGHCSDCTHLKKNRPLEMCLEYNIKIGGPAESHSLSQIIGMFGCSGIFMDELSSIQQNPTDSTITSENASLIELLVKS